MCSLKTCLVFTFLLHLVLAEEYLFQIANISFKEVLHKHVRIRRTYRYLTALDQHVFANAINIGIETQKMNMFEGAVKNLPHLRVLRLKNCDIEELPPKTFKNLPKLKLVHLQDNSLTTIEEGVFNYLPIKELWLHKNDIEVIQSGAFDNMPYLELIRLSSNELTSWDSNWFANTPRLTELYFHKNFIEELPAKAFANIKTSHKIAGHELVDTKIFLTNNKISLIHPAAFHGIDSLDELWLKKNKISKIDKNMFSHMTQLHVLSLKRNHLTEIDKMAFEHLSEMMELDLSRNYLTCVPYEVVSVAKFVNVTGNEEVDCDCLFNLREKLSEDRRENKIADNKCAYD